MLKHSLIQIGLFKLCHTNLRFPRCDIAEALIQLFLLGIKLVHSSLQLALHFMNLLFSEHELLLVELQLLLLSLQVLLLVCYLGNLLFLREVFLLALHELIFCILQVRLHDCQLILCLL